MSVQSMLNSLAQILETDGWDSMKEAGAEVESINVTDDFMLLEMTDQSGETKTFQVVEIDA